MKIPAPCDPGGTSSLRVPVMLVGMEFRQPFSGQPPGAARIRNAAEIFPKDDDNDGRPADNVIEIMEKDGKPPVNVNRVFVSYYNLEQTTLSPSPALFRCLIRSIVTLSDTHTLYLLDKS